MGLLDFLFGTDESTSSSSKRTTTYDNSFFRRNDEDRSVCEDMFGMRSNNHDTDLKSHFDWDHRLNYDSDRYSDEEKW